ncbi:mechanosensitive ion channel family protein [Crocosphaera sp. XPORK-15E]|uniref:mechanosensitive ion channel family protein n=1 Tax=Crocosphaera sp. XPORK-15E TaxID=3110247 RepID=UPI002B1E9B44|nr:mechanosensitive ion channel domain-containing protein [Crocosphaera sp. XPORK-15E]MEA5533921.1 mechanosensitive ion channel domain-containing protein [Crocosphaera sp. XPORK-15E]
MTDQIASSIDIQTIIIFAIVTLILMFLSIGIVLLPRVMGKIITHFLSGELPTIYEKIIVPYHNWLGLIMLLTVTDLLMIFLHLPAWLKLLEIPLGLSINVLIIWVGFQIFQDFFDRYLLEAAIASSSKLNSEFIIIAKYFANAAIIFIVLFIFAETHNINVLGLFASLGIGGLAVAFAAQKSLEQLLGGIVLYLDKPFVADDYIGLADGTFGRVESVGLRSTKIRTSGKGTLMIVPNSSLTQINIENFTGGKKVVSLIYLTFYSLIPEDEKALIRQVILESTSDIFGIDSRSTEVIFKQMSGKNGKSPVTQAQINFFILGSGEVSMELRRQFLEIANQQITHQLKEYGIAFEIEDRTINVDSPITI